MTEHTTEDNFQHFLAYTNAPDVPALTEILRHAYYSGANVPGCPDIPKWRELLPTLPGQPMARRGEATTGVSDAMVEAAAIALFAADTGTDPLDMPLTVRLEYIGRARAALDAALTRRAPGGGA